MILFLDTDVLADVLRGGRSADRLLRMRLTEDPPVTCAINVEELARELTDTSALETLLEGVRLVPLGGEEATRAGRWRAEYARKGRRLTQATCLIAAAAEAAGARIATGRPRDYPMLEVERWQLG